MRHSARVLVLGIDGANWVMLEPWIEAGKLPNLKKLRDRSAWGEMEACLPITTSPNWKCYSTGKNPGKLGVYRFDAIDIANKKFIVNNSRSFRSLELWDYLSLAGKRVGIINMPTTYPPKRLNGFMISGGPDAVEGEFRSNRGLDYVNPPELREYIEGKFGYKVHPEPMIGSGVSAAASIEAIKKLTRIRFETAMDLLDRYQVDFLQLTCFYVQALQHFFWTDKCVLETWQIIDSYIPKLLERCQYFVLHSDHGIAKVETTFYINVWLEENGYLRMKKTIDDTLFRLGVSREKLLRTANSLGLTRVLARVLPDSLVKLIPWSEGIRKSRVFEKTDWGLTRAFGCTLGPIYINAPCGSPEYLALRKELVSKLQAIKCPRSGRRILRRVYTKEEAFHGPYLELAPDLVALHEDWVCVSDSVGKKNYLGPPETRIADNVPIGISLFHGDIMEPSKSGFRCSITDLAPTILRLMDVPVPEDVDGDVLDIFQPHIKREWPTQAARHAIDESFTSGEEEAIKKRLESLGYLS